MYLTEEILEKLNTKNSKLKSAIGQEITLPDIMMCSFAQVQELAGDALNWGEKNFLYQQAQVQLKENQMAESRILSRANPQLANAVRLGIRQSSMRAGYDDLFPERSSQYVKPGSVASMFSPAGYLTELYREARGLHKAESQYHLDTRRPDLASLLLSQSNMDDELSTLSLSNELLLNNIQQHDSIDNAGVLKMLASYRLTGATPYSQPYETVRQAILLQDPAFTAFRNNPAVAAKVNTSTLLGLRAELSPGLYDMLTEDITEDNAEQLIKENFGDIDINIFQNVSYLANWYGLNYDEFSSLLDIVMGANNLIDGVQYFQNNELISLVEDNGKLNAVLMTRTPGENYDQFGYIELIPVSGDTYQLRFTVQNGFVGENSMLLIGTTGPESADLLNNGYIPGHNLPFTINVQLDSAKLAEEVIIGVTRKNPNGSGGYQYSTVHFRRYDFSYNVFLLKLNKLIRLYKATGIAPSIIQNVIASLNDDMAINADVLSRLFWMNHYAQRYSIDSSAALVLAGADIDQTAANNKPDAFTQLFNTPPLNNQFFYADGEELNLEPGKSSDTQSLGVLKRALQVNDTALYTLFKLTFADKDNQGKATVFTNTIANLSALYRTRLLATVNNLTVNELSLLLSVSPYVKVTLATLKDNDLSQLSASLERYTQWLQEMNWTVGDLYLMLAPVYSTVLSPDIENLVATLKNGLAGQDLTSDEKRITAVAPFVAAATQLDSAETAEAILQWLNQLKPGTLTLADFIDEVNNTRDSKKLVTFCQVMAQLALIARNASLSASELSWSVTHPEIFRENSLKHDLTTLVTLTQLHALLARCGSHASEILTSLSGKGSGAANNLAVSTLAAALSLDEQALTQALAQVSSYEYFYNAAGIIGALQWLDVATTFGITPANLAALIKLKFNSQDDSSYASWLTASQFMQAGLNAQQTAQLTGKLDESLSAAVSAYAIKNIAHAFATNREQLYSWLLIDNQVSAQIKTTRIAEAIASVQLYVNRVLGGLENGSSATDAVDNAVKSGAFFTRDWDIYNKRYSTWAGVSELVYYPENYIDPTLRLGQTSMMNEMLQTLSQSQLTSDTVEDAFKTYMTRFEEIANLDIVSGYHDGVSDRNGITYLIGRSALGDYYWRSADISMLSDGRLPANAWAEWKKITTAMTPEGNMVRPVIFQSRLYVTWVESREVAISDGKQTGADKILEYALKYAHILHDGTWSAPVSVPLEDGTLPLNGVAINDTGMYCAKDATQEKLTVYYYKKANSYEAIPGHIAGVNLYPDGTVENIPTSSINKIAGYIYLQLDTTSAVRLNTPYTGGITQVGISDNRRTDFSWGEGGYSVMLDGSVNVTSATVSDSLVTLSFDSVARVIYRGVEGNRAQTQVELMKIIGKIEDVFYLPRIRGKSYAAAISGRDFVYVGKGNDFNLWVLDGITPVRNDRIYVYNDPSPDNANSTAKNFNYPLTETAPNSKIWTGTYNNIKSQDYLYAFMSPGAESPATSNDFIFGEFRKLDTAIYLNGVKLFVSWDPTADFSADSCSAYSLDESIFHFSNKTVSIPLSVFANNTAKISFNMKATSRNNWYLGQETHVLTLVLIDKGNMPVISLNKTTEGAQYLQYGFHRIRVNTLFAKQLVSRANAGLNTVLSMETQQLQEPKLGDGSYVKVIFDRYDKSKHGDGTYKLYIVGLESNVSENVRSKFNYSSGQVSKTDQTTVSVFVPHNPDKTGDEKDTVFIGVQYSSHDYTNSYEDMQRFTYDANNKVFIADNENKSRERGFASQVINSEPMDFNGANALYFWEMFYYVPMMVFKRLLSERKYTEATQWIQYIWNPDGYLANGQPATYAWNVRPLEEETTWHANPLDSVDPDAVAQADPLHYKIATFMAYLDLLIARGDTAYRQLERDTLNEAKMWYVQALNILGDESYQSSSSGWIAPVLSSAADQTTEKNVQQAMLAVRQQLDAGELRTGNSLTDLFLPQQNEKLASYWQTLAQRLYNLRHNLSIDGSPLSLAIYATPADPAALLSAAVNSASGGSGLPAAVMPLYRFPVILESARGMAGQLAQFGSTLLSIAERQDAEALSELLQTQGSALILQSIALQSSAIDEIDADKTALEAARSGAQQRLARYTTLYEENINAGERQVMDLSLAAAIVATTASVSYTVAAGLEAVPNIYGLAFGGSRYGAIARAVGTGIEIGANAARTAADRISQSEAWRRRRQEWEIQRNSAQSEVDQIDAQLASLAVRREGAVLQKIYLETQQSQMQAQMTFLQNKFTSKALYNWLRGKLAAIYYQFYDLTVSRCLMAEAAYSWEIDGTQETGVFIRPGAWQGTYAGLMAGETLMLNLAQMENSYLTKDERLKEVTRTVCLSDVYEELSSDKFALADAVTTLVTQGDGKAGSDDNGVKINDGQLQATLKLSDLKIGDDYPSTLGNTRRIKQISVTLPALVGPYQDVRAMLSYGGSVVLPRGCTAAAVSHGMNDSGQFQLDFNDSRWLPFEGIPVGDSGKLTLSFPDATGKQKELLLSLADIILHIRYTIAS